MNKSFWILLVLLWFALLLILIISLTEIYPNNPFQQYRLAIGASFLILSELMRRFYGKLKR